MVASSLPDRTGLLQNYQSGSDNSGLPLPPRTHGAPLLTTYSSRSGFPSSPSRTAPSGRRPEVRTPAAFPSPAGLCLCQEVLHRREERACPDRLLQGTVGAQHDGDVQ